MTTTLTTSRSTSVLYPLQLMRNCPSGQFHQCSHSSPDSWSSTSSFMKALCAHGVGYKQSLFTRFPTRVSLMLSDTKSLCKKTAGGPGPSGGKYWRLTILGEPNQLWRGQAFTSSRLARQRDHNQTPFHLPVLLVAVATFLSHRHLTTKNNTSPRYFTPIRTHIR